MNRTAVATVVIAIVLSAFELLAAPTASAETNSDQVARQFREYCLRESTDHGQRILDDVELPTSSPEKAMQNIAALKTDGSWPDLDYNNKARSAWQPGDHLTRTLCLIVQARRDGTSAAESKQCIEAVHRALGFWIQHDFNCPNWWYNDIGGPKILGTIGLLMGDDLQPQELAFIANTALARSKVGSLTGQNRVWLAGNGVMRGALMHDDQLIQTAAGVIADEIRVSEKEGIQPDWSFHQHGPQQQFGNYGMAFAVDMARWAIVLRGTPYAFPVNKISVIRNYLLQGQNWISWNGSMDISACGRQLFPGMPIKKAGIIRAVMRNMISVDPDHARDYLAYVSRNSPGGTNDLIGTQLFWRSDYLIARQSDWMVSLKMSSERVVGGETVNTENLSGLYLADGATFIYRTGHEYDDIFPSWDWRMIPGTTEVLDHASLAWTAKADHAHTAFVGGACDGVTAVGAMDFHRGQLKAKKAWFFAGDCIVCLGADVDSTGPDQVVTTIDQSLLAGPIVIQQKSKQTTILSGSQQLADVDWIEHAGTRYVSLLPQSMSLSAQPRTGNWHAVFENPASPNADVTKNVFTLSIDHGKQPHAATYAYAITPAGSDAANAVGFLVDTEKVQAITIGSTWSAAIFWTAGSISLHGGKIEVDQPCTLLVNDHKITIADPTHKLKSLKLSVAGHAKTIDLPQGGEAGKSVTVDGT